MKDMKHHILTLAVCLLTLTAQAQTDYEIEQRLDGRIVKMQINSGWKVNLVADTVNAIVIHTPCEYFFAEGNEPNICRMMPDGTLAVWQNRTMPQGTRLDIHYREPFESLYLHPKATVGSDRLLLRDTNQNGHYGSINVKRGASLQVSSLNCNGFLSIDADSNANVRVDTVRAGFLMLYSQHESTLRLDSIEAKEVKYYRNPRAHDKLWHSNPSRNIKVKTRNRWFTHGLKRLDNTLGLAFNTPFEQKYNNPLASVYNITLLLGLKTNVIPINQHLGLSLGIDFGETVISLQNNVTLTGRTLSLDTVSPGVNRQNALMQIHLGLPVRMHYLPQGEFAKSFNDIHFGIEPLWYPYQTFFSNHYTSNHVSRVNRVGGFWDFGKRVNAYNPLQIRAEIGFRINPYSNAELNFFVDLLPTYHHGTGQEKAHTFGFQIRF